VGQGGFAYPWYIVNQQVATGQKAGYAVLNLAGFAHNHRVKLIANGVKFVLYIHGLTLPENVE
jgi:hypothetical protein